MNDYATEPRRRTVVRRMMLRASTAVGRWLACNSSAATWTQIVQECTRNLWYRAGNVDFDFETNGELRVVEVLGAANEKSAVVFDVGANLCGTGLN